MNKRDFKSISYLQGYPCAIKICCRFVMKRPSENNLDSCTDTKNSEQKHLVFLSKCKWSVINFKLFPKSTYDKIL